MIKNFLTGEVFYTDTDHLYGNPHRSSESQKVVDELMKISEALDDIAHRLFKVSGSRAINERLKGNLESKAEAISCVSSDIYKQII